MKDHENLLEKTLTHHSKHPLRRAARYWALAIVMMLLAVSSASADIAIELVKGKRAVKDKVSFTIEVDHEKDENPRYAKMPEFLWVEHVAFAAPASGILLLDGKGIDRFDETYQFSGNRTEITYGRHVITLQVSAPAIVTQLRVVVRGGVVREIIGEESHSPATGAESRTETSASRNTEERVADLERRVKQLEAEVEALKKGRRNP